MFQRVRQGVLFGMAMAVFYSVFVSGIYLVRGPDYLDSYDAALWQVIGSYFAGGILAGAIVGALQPLVRFRVGAMIVFSLAAFFVFACIVVADKGSFQFTGEDWFATIVCGVLFGVMGSFFFRDWVL
jgi:hypothetical protein